MNAQIKSLEHGAYGLLAATGVGTSSLKWLDLLNGYAGALGVIMTFIFGVTGVCLTMLAHSRKDKQAEKNKKEIAKLQLELKRIEVSHGNSP